MTSVHTITPFTQECVCVCVSLALTLETAATADCRTCESHFDMIDLSATPLHALTSHRLSRVQIIDYLLIELLQNTISSQ